MSGAVRVVVADRRRTVAEVLATGLHQVGLTTHAVTALAEARALAAAGRADLVVADIGLLTAGPTAAGPSWGRDLPVPLVVLSDGSRDAELVTAAVRAGVRGWVPKDSALQHLLVVIRGVLRGETWLPPVLLTTVVDELVALRSAQDEGAERLATLTAREREVLGCLCAGLSRPEIGRRLFLSTNTVRTHVQNMMLKLDVHSSVAAVALANRVGPPPLPEP
ncbi:transcriptional regulator [Kitasatospora sp. MMS16-BH015]|uniref:response regulator transcription factor n=1 Tax=Kitasatospora sp. MMS16-BH015 TaxID=2018025 RepID=UPI000CA227DE|nr:response regulator transcription factor [Kitasatospora sp. MMS16-BH015]AUG80622.1 transcriptional regulator [Kitasatospora sp. MMS16-BH015]